MIVGGKPRNSKTANCEGMNKQDLHIGETDLVTEICFKFRQIKNVGHIKRQNSNKNRIGEKIRKKGARVLQRY